MEKLINTEAALKKIVAYKKACNCEQTGLSLTKE